MEAREDKALKEEIKQKLIPICIKSRHDNFDKSIVKQIVEDVYDELESYI